MLIEMGNVYTKRIFKEFQIEYFHSIESNIEAIEYGEVCTIYSIVDVVGKHARKVKRERDGSLGCNCTRAKTVKDIKGNDIQANVKFQQASQYKTLMTAFKAITCRAAETEKTYDFSVAQLATLGANVESKLSAHFAIENEVSNDDEAQSFEVDYEDKNHVVQPKGLKKNVATSNGKMRVKGGFELALVANSKKKMSC
ncbi:hypothetical protein ACSBR2_001939 [Camellia fascicularis]